MKSLLKYQEKNNTSDLRKILNLPVKQSNYIINQISKLGADHDVTVSGTMIKVTYKKPSKAQIISPNSVNGIYCSADSIPIHKSLISTVNKLSVCNYQNKSNIGTSKSVKTSEKLTIPKNKTSIYLNKPTGHTLIHSTSRKNILVEEKSYKQTLSRMNLLKKFEELKQISGMTQHINSSVTMKSKNSTTPINLTSKPISIKASTSDKFQGPPPSIKIPKGITIIRLKSNTNSKDGKVLKTISSEKLIIPKDKRQQNSGLKRKITVKDNVKPTKIMKKGENLSSQKNNKELINYNDITDFCETIIGEDLSVNSLCNNNNNNKKEIMLDDPELPQGWKRVVHTRYEGTPFAKHVVYIYSPQGKKFQFKWKLRKYLERTKSSLCAEQFHFGLYKKTKSIIVPPENKSEKDKSSPPKTQDCVIKSQAPSTLSRNVIVSRAKAFNLKHSNSISRNLSKSRLSHYKAGLKNKQVSGHPAKTHLNSIANKDASLDKKQLLLYDPDLPFGWKRIINSNNSNGKLQVNIISPEGRIFRRRYRLHEYLIKHQYSHSLDRFYFGLYPKKDLIHSDQDEKSKRYKKMDEISENANHSHSEFNDDAEDSDKDNIEDLILSETDMSKFAQYSTPMYEDPNLPEGWQRFIKIRACGKSAGRMEVVIVSPDGKRLRSRGQLQSYIKKNDLNYDANDFDFSVFGHTKKQIPVTESKQSLNSNKRRTRSPVYTHRPVPDLDINALKETKVTPEGDIINKVAGIMISCGLSSGRSERRLRVPRKEHENNLKAYLNSNDDINFDDNVVPTSWIQKLVKCRSDFRNLEFDAALTLANKTKEFIKELSLRAFNESNAATNGLQYEDIANIVNKYKSLALLEMIIPQKITYKEYVKINRPKQFLSFT